MKKNEIEILFNQYPILKDTIKNPILISNSLFSSILNQTLNNNNDDDTLYKIVFKENSSKKLMTISNGELKGLKTSICIEKGKISDIAGLKKVDTKIDNNLLPILLNISLFSSIQYNLSYISNLCTDIRNHQIVQEQAKFERISEVIVDCFKSLPDIALDNSMKAVYLSRIVKNNDDCYEIFISQKYDFKKVINSETSPYSVGYNYYYYEDYQKGRVYPDRFFRKKILTHSIFLVFERFVAGKICEILISGNFSNENINRYRETILKTQNEIKTLMEHRLKAFDNFTEEINNEIENNLDLTGYEKKEKIKQLKYHLTFVKEVKKDINVRLDEKSKSIDILSYLTNKENIEVYLIDNKIVINNPITNNTLEDE